ncbi:WXG100 family type VII secretion target [Kitasatospora sp. NPDC059648]|uniref:WXG100-like domain-containing protein n=1 Tax=Kitasatospora sp. NPDC059648 TaxID=3346894 RepID=UPI003690838A
MAIELPHDVVTLLNLIGIKWPTVNEDKVRDFAHHVRQFAKDVEATHGHSSATVKQVGESYEGESYEALAKKWAAASNDHFDEIVQACHTVATALDVAADTIVAAKVATIAELTVLAAAFIADQAAAVATFGLAEVAVVAIEETAKRLVNALVQQLEQHIIAEVIEAAISPLIDTVSEAVTGLVFEAAAAGANSAGSGYKIDPAGLEAHARTMHEHAQAVATHAETFRTKVAAVSFE